MRRTVYRAEAQERRSGEVGCARACVRARVNVRVCTCTRARVHVRVCTCACARAGVHVRACKCGCARVGGRSLHSRLWVDVLENAVELVQNVVRVCRPAALEPKAVGRKIAAARTQHATCPDETSSVEHPWQMQHATYNIPSSTMQHTVRRPAALEPTGR
jgi:hypothetical protein